MNESMNPVDVAWDLAHAANREWDAAEQSKLEVKTIEHRRNTELFIQMAGLVINRDSDNPFKVEPGVFPEESEYSHDTEEQDEPEIRENSPYEKPLEGAGKTRSMREAATVAAQESAMSYAHAEELLDHIKDDKIVDNLIKRHQIKQFLRSIFDSLDFIEVDTPILGSAMTEYTKDNFLVRGNAGEFYLPQSPQVYKQALVINTFPKYFQFAKCFRDEDHGERTDQLLEFTQIDLELRCDNELELRDFAEEIMSQLFSKFGKKCVTPFPIIDYQECLAKYGTDKPDLRSDSDENAFLWVVNFPQFIKNDLGETVTTHHPFQMPIIDDVSDVSNKTFEIGSSTFDLVLNGVEIGGGDMRINDYEIQKEVLKVLGLKTSQFALLLESLKDGHAPKHGGMAIGLDRITMAITGAEKITEVTAFNL